MSSLHSSEYNNIAITYNFNFNAEPTEFRIQAHNNLLPNTKSKSAKSYWQWQYIANH